MNQPQRLFSQSMGHKHAQQSGSIMWSCLEAYNFACSAVKGCICLQACYATLTLFTMLPSYNGPMAFYLLYLMLQTFGCLTTLGVMQQWYYLQSGNTVLDSATLMFPLTWYLQLSCDGVVFAAIWCYTRPWYLAPQENARCTSDF